MSFTTRVPKPVIVDVPGVRLNVPSNPTDPFPQKNVVPGGFPPNKSPQDPPSKKISVKGPDPQNPEQARPVVEVIRSTTLRLSWRGIRLVSVNTNSVPERLPDPVNVYVYVSAWANGTQSGTPCLDGGSRAWIRTRVHATTLSSGSSE